MNSKRKKSSNSSSAPTQTHLFEVYEAKRKYPRIIIDTPVSIKKSKGELIMAIVHDISLDGLQVRCDRESAQKLHPGGIYIKENKGPKVDVSFSLSLYGGNETVSVNCQIYYLAVTSDDEIAFGLVFKKFKTSNASLVDRFIMESIVPVDDKVRSFLEKPRTQSEISKHMEMQGTEVVEILERLRIKGDVISYGSDSGSRHLKLSSSLELIFNKLSKFEKRLSSLEKALKKA